MSNENSVSAIETIKVEAHPVEVGTSCIICHEFISLGYGFCGNYVPTVKICDECRERLMKILYKEKT